MKLISRINGDLFFAGLSVALSVFYYIGLRQYIVAAIWAANAGLGWHGYWSHKDKDRT